MCCFESIDVVSGKDIEEQRIEEMAERQELEDM